jgi:hypothetical protein
MMHGQTNINDARSNKNQNKFESYLVLVSDPFGVLGIPGK